MLYFPAVTKQAATTGLNLWLYTVLPALLPYTIISSLLLYLNAFAIPCKIFEKIFKRKLPETPMLIVICGYLCGCPIGAKLAADSYKTGKINKNTAEFLMCACNNLSPSFLINYVFVQVYAPFIHLSSTYKWIIFLILAFSTILGSAFAHFICKRFATKKKQTYCSKNIFSNKNIPKQEKPSFSNFFEDCILSSFEIQAKIGGYIILFTIINNLFLYTLNLSDLQAGILGSILEVTSGLGLFSTSSNVAFSSQAHLIPALITALTTFGGLCTIFQTKSVLSGTDLSILKYGLAKFISGIVAFVIALFFL